VGACHPPRGMPRQQVPRQQVLSHRVRGLRGFRGWAVALCLCSIGSARSAFLPSPKSLVELRCNLYSTVQCSTVLYHTEQYSRWPVL